MRAGKIRYWALSNFRGWRIAEVARLCEQLGVPRPVCCQPYYNLLNRMPEVEILPACGHYGLGVVPYKIARGVLTGKYLPGQQPPEGTAQGVPTVASWRPSSAESLLIAQQQLAAHAEARGLTLGQFATAWVLANPLVSAVIAGPRTLAQFEDYFGALGVALSPQEEAMVDALASRPCLHARLQRPQLSLYRPPRAGGCELVRAVRAAPGRPPRCRPRHPGWHGLHLLRGRASVCFRARKHAHPRASDDTSSIIDVRRNAAAGLSPCCQGS